ncbi:MAG: hypothetical protein ABSB89_09035 [Candidatus Bathyarchaeia archaeon]|jgi:ABC-type oligopeptide transport system substrate-binding subunit
MSQTKPSETKPKKMVSRSLAITLGIVCILLIAGLGGAIAYYTNTINNKDSTYNDYVSTHHHTDSDYGSLNTQNTNLQNQVNGLNTALNLGNSTVWVSDQTVSQPAGGLGISYTTWAESASYAGYVSISVTSSTTASTDANVVYSAYGVSYNNPITVGTSGTANFPVLPSSSITVEVGNGNLVGGATETVTITYYY